FILPIGATVLALSAIALGIKLFHREGKGVDLLGGPFGWLYRFAANKYYLDDFYLKGIVKPIQYSIARATYWTNQNILDAAVNGAGRGAVAFSHPVYDVLDQQVVDFAVNGEAGLMGYSGGLLKYIQSGNVQRYAAVLFGAIAVFVALFVLA
ncbi:MAG: hypothetical protein LC808_33805, partial [Actinobacteria bacterium]|nr:hypothetical protein [Actinomycetota bacterium]